MCSLCKTAYALTVIGALNWGLIGLGAFMNADWNVVHKILGNWPIVEAIVYVLVGIGGLVLIFGKNCPCRKKMA